MNTHHRNGDWALTYTGKQFYPLDARPEDVCIEDIAHALSLVCRYGGHCREFYCVAQHSLIVSVVAPPKKKFQALMHDATEAYIGDMVRPLKYNLPEFMRAEDRLWAVICERFNLPVEIDPEVKHADNVVLMTEKRDLLIESPHAWGLEGIELLPGKIIPWSPQYAEQEFLQSFTELYSG